MQALEILNFLQLHKKNTTDKILKTDQKTLKIDNRQI